MEPFKRIVVFFEGGRGKHSRDSEILFPDKEKQQRGVGLGTTSLPRQILSFSSSRKIGILPLFSIRSSTVDRYGNELLIEHDSSKKGIRSSLDGKEK